MKTCCNYCDPKYFVIYGFCRNCWRRCEFPLFDPDGGISLIEWDESRRKWNAQRSDLITDAMRRTANDSLGHNQAEMP